MADVGAAPTASQSVSRGGDWILRFCDAAPLGPFGLGLAAFVLFLSAFVLWNGLIGSFDAWQLPDGSWSGRRLFVEAVNALLFGYCIAAYAVARSGALADLERLRPALEPLDERDAGLRRIVSPGRWIPGASLAAGALCGWVMINDPRVWDEFPRPPFPHPLLVWVFLRNSLIAGAGILLGCAEVRLMRGFSRLAAERARVDLLDLRAFEPLVRRGQRSVVIWILLSSLLSIFWLQGSAASLNGLAVAAMVGLAAAAFLLPLSGVRRRIVAAKRAELERVNAAIRREREVALTEIPASTRPETARLADLVAYRSFVEGLHEWPLNAPALVRFVFFLLLGLGSWLGGALVERALESVLD